MEDRLKKFAQVVDSGSFTRAALALHISQPALSVALGKLERELGAELLVHGHHPLRPTKAGQAAYRYAKSLSANSANFKQELAALAGEKPQLTIGMIDSIADALFVHGQHLQKLESHAHITLSVNNSRYLARSLERGQLDIAFIATPHEDSPKTLVRTDLGAEPLVAVTHPQRFKRTLQAYKNNFLPDFISYDQHSNTSRLIRQHFLKKGKSLRPIFHSTSPQIILHMALANRGCAVLPFLDVREHLKKGELKAVAGPVPRPIIALQLEGRDLPLPLIELVKTVKITLKQLSAEFEHQDSRVATLKIK